VRVNSEASHRTRSLHAARAKLVEMRREVSHQLRGVPQTFGHRVGVLGTGQAFEARAHELAEGDAALSAAVEALLGSRAALAEEVARLDRLLLTQARQIPPAGG
jgi:transposase